MIETTFGSTTVKDCLTRIILIWWEPDGQGNIAYSDELWGPKDADVQWFKTYCQNHGIELLLGVHNCYYNSTPYGFSWERVKPNFVNPTYRANLVDNLKTEMLRLGLDGVDIDFEPDTYTENLHEPLDRAPFNELVQELSVALGSTKTVGVASFCYENYYPCQTWWPDWAGVADIHIMGYWETYEGAPASESWRRYSSQQATAANAGHAVDYPAEDVFMGLDGTKDRWPDIGTQGSATHKEHVEEILALDTPMNICIWSSHFGVYDAGTSSWIPRWHDNDLWSKIKELRDWMPPLEVSITSPTEGATLNKANALAISSTVVSDGTVESCEYRIDDGSWIAMTHSGGNVWEITVDISAYPSGPHMISVKATDESSGTDIDTVNVTFFRPGMPTVGVLSPASGTQFHSDDGSISLVVNAGDETAINKVEYRIDSGSWTEITADRISGNSQDGVYAVGIPVLSVGDHTLETRVYDADPADPAYSQQITISFGDYPRGQQSITFDSDFSDWEVGIGEYEAYMLADNTQGSLTVRVKDGVWWAASGAYANATYHGSGFSGVSVNLTTCIASPSFWEVRLFGDPGDILHNFSSGETAVNITGISADRIKFQVHLPPEEADDGVGNGDPALVIDSVVITLAGGSLVAPSVDDIVPFGGSIGGEITVEATCSDADGDSNISFAEFRFGESGDWIAMDGSEADWSRNYDTTLLSDGAINLYVRCRDEGFLWDTDDSVSVTINNGSPEHDPVADITTPTEGSTVSRSTALSITATATDEDGNETITACEYRIDAGTWIAMSGTAPDFSVSGIALESYANGAHTIDVKATDDTARQHTDTVNVTFDGADPAVTINAPSDGSTVNKTVPLTIEANVSDADGDSITECEYQIDSDGWNPMSDQGGGVFQASGVDISAYSDAGHVISVRATDDSGDQGTTSVTVTFSSTGEAVMFYLSLAETDVSGS